MVRSMSVSGKKWKSSCEKTLKNHSLHQIKKSRLNRSCLYLCLVKINNKWRMKLGQTDNLYKGVYAMSFQYRIDAKNLDELDLVNVIPLGIWFKKEKFRRNEVKNEMRKKFKLYQTNEPNISKSKSREIFEVIPEIFSEMKHILSDKHKVYVNNDVIIMKDSFISIVNGNTITITN